MGLGFSGFLSCPTPLGTQEATAQGMELSTGGALPSRNSGDFSNLLRDLPEISPFGLKVPTVK